MASRSYAAIHVARKQAGLSDDEAWREYLLSRTGKQSLRLMSGDELKLVRDGLPSGNPKARGLAGPYAKKLQALWISAWNLGIVRNNKDEALLAFVERQTGIQRTEFLRKPEHARAAIEALKKWMAREGGVDWEVASYDPDFARNPRFKIVSAQVRLAYPKRNVSQPQIRRDIIHDLTGFRNLNAVPDNKWLEVQQKLGELIRGQDHDARLSRPYARLAA